MFLSPERSKQILQLTQNLGCSVNALFIALMSIVLSKKKETIMKLDPKKQRYNQLFQVCVNYYNTQMVHQIGDFSFSYEELYSGYQFDDDGNASLDAPGEDKKYTIWQWDLEERSGELGWWK